MKGQNELIQNIRNTFEMLHYPARSDEIGLCVMDYHTRKILFANSKAIFYARYPELTCAIEGCCGINKGFEAETACIFCEHERPIHRNKLYPKLCVREIYVKDLDVWLKVINQIVAGEAERLVHVITFHDISETKKLREQISECMLRDRLLGLKNDICLEQDMRDANEMPSVILIKLSALAKINATHGREIGDYLLCSVKDRILEMKIPDSELYRISGESLCLTVGNISLYELKKLADSLSRLITRAESHEKARKRLWVSCGTSIAVIPSQHIHKGEAILSMIERMRDQIKRHKVIIYSRSADEAQKDRLGLELSLERCINENMRGFDVYYQPIVDAVSGEWRSLEAVCRWRSPGLGEIPPLVFIPEAERLELIDQLSRWVLGKAVAGCKAWGLDHCEGFVLNVNLSAAQLVRPSLAKGILEIIHSFDYPGEKLCLEITESIGTTFSDRSLCEIEKLRKHNILVALDDFGTGYSSFDRLKTMPVDIVKIDRVFITDIESDEYQQYLFRAMAELAHAGDMKLIGEGIERESQKEILAKNGADYLQGYLFGKPMPSDQMERQLGRFRGQRRFVG